MPSIGISSQRNSSMRFGDRVLPLECPELPPSRSVGYSLSMPLYEYYCEHCNGIFESLRPMRESGDPSPCPECDRDASRIPPTTFAAFTFREGYPRSIPDKGTYWHLGKEVKQRIKGSFKPWQHPEINKPEPPRKKSKGELAIEREKRSAERREMAKKTGITRKITNRSKTL
jgi:putative FmdB family regulatory protein